MSPPAEAPATIPEEPTRQVHVVAPRSGAHVRLEQVLQNGRRVTRVFKDLQSANAEADRIRALNGLPPPLRPPGGRYDGLAPMRVRGPYRAGTGFRLVMVFEGGETKRSFTRREDAMAEIERLRASGVAVAGSPSPARPRQPRSAAPEVPPPTAIDPARRRELIAQRHEVLVEAERTKARPLKERRSRAHHDAGFDPDRHAAANPDFPERLDGALRDLGLQPPGE